LGATKSERKKLHASEYIFEKEASRKVATRVFPSTSSLSKKLGKGDRREKGHYIISEGERRNALRVPNSQVLRDKGLDNTQSELSF